ncbi:Mitogen-activated protein kinase kinase 9 [Forsythia ovata]|uniref:mitogen-activated protein kinase kinase n=1 Tax=Forsythia ovata TaxID=205694 RepID=A0ABD1WVT3_9LAMI
MVLSMKRPLVNLHVQLPKPVEIPQYIPTPLILLPTQEVQHVSDLEKLQVLGSGNGGTVYRVCHKKSSKVYALKVIRGGATEQVRQEIEILRCCTDSPNIVQCHGVFEESFGDISILMEYMEAGSLDVLAKTTLGSFSETIIANIAYQSLTGLDYLHSKKIVHRDIKPSNLLVTREMQVKIADFGVSKIIKSSENACNGSVGTCAYMSPEKFDSDGKDYNVFAGDVWSLGLTLMELYIGHYPYMQPGKEAENKSVIWEICFEEPPCMPKDASEHFKDFIQCCLQKDWTKRWTARQLLTHPFIISAREKVGLGSIVLGTKRENSVQSIEEIGEVVAVRKKSRV